MTSPGGRRPSSLQGGFAEVPPTPLTLVGVSERLPRSDTWPAWVLALFTLLASAEAFLLVRLVRARSFARTIEQLEELPDL